MVISSCEAWMAEGNPKTDPWTGERRSQLRRSRERRSWSRKSRSRERRSRSRERRSRSREKHSRSRERRSRCGAEFETKTQHECMKKVEWISPNKCDWVSYCNLFVASIVAVQSHSSSLGERLQKRWEHLQICSRAKSRPWPEWRLRTPVSCYVSEWYWIALCSANRNPMTSHPHWEDRFRQDGSDTAGSFDPSEWYRIRSMYQIWPTLHTCYPGNITCTAYVSCMHMYITECAYIYIYIYICTYACIWL